MNEQEASELKLKRALEECEQHVARLAYAKTRLVNLFPLTVERYIQLSDEQVSVLDQMLFRFGKLQDAMGQRMLPAILRAGLEWRESDTFLDMLNRLEKLGVIRSVSEWIELRELRNNAMHEYPDEPQINVANLNKIYDSIAALEDIWEHVRHYSIDRFGFR